ncbi:hypothetical protein BRARA_H00226 [Brassica rapa]|uniref:1-acylglycerol-3-phosphate O-acyltransferase n=1 Tax=Brassica campestris TaxID=3711 RepID=A0A397Y755_BRACM|nr:hypothetical protein BRARA_H00226 [Brassica rapa]
MCLATKTEYFLYELSKRCSNNLTITSRKDYESLPSSSCLFSVYSLFQSWQLLRLFFIFAYGLLFLVSGLIVNLIQINLYADAETLELLGKEHALVLSNHRGDIDWLVGWVMAQRSGCLGSTLAIMRKEAKYFPIIGWSMWFSEYIFLEKNWAKDEKILKAGFNQLKDFPTTFWLGLFVEGTRFNQKNLEAAKAYASLKGLPTPRNVLIPRTKVSLTVTFSSLQGFVSAVTHMRSFVPAIYDCTYTVDKKQTTPTLLRMFSGQSSEVNLQMRRYKMSQLPETADGIAQWCQDLFVAKV